MSYQRISAMLALCLVVAAFSYIFIQRFALSENKNIVSRDILRPDEAHFLARTYPDFTLDLEAYVKTVNKAKQHETLNLKNSATDTPWNLEGPTNIGGRINTIAVHPTNSDIIYVGCAKGGVFKTTDGGDNWIPIFDDQPFLAIGHIALDPVNPEIVYVGTGDVNISITFAVGNGLYKSTDGGNTWTNIGLAEGRIISKIRINPQNPSEIYVGTMGNPYERDENRGLYKTTNGGNSWNKVLFVDDDAGVVDVVMNPENPSIVYATSWNRIRNNQETIVAGEDCKIWKTVNGGANWTNLTNGLPEGDLNRIGLDIFAANPNILVAVIVDVSSQLNGVYRTDDGGDSWYQIASSDSFGGDDPLGNFGWYFGKININPLNDQEIYLLGVDLHKTTNNGTDWQLATPEWWIYDVHADKHALVFTQENSILLATDGGLYRSDDSAASWVDVEDIPNTQFYRIAYNPHQPGIYTGGAQDNGTTSGSIAAIDDWIRIYGADGFQPVYHPTDPNIFYCEMQNGSIVVTSNGGDSFSGCNSGIDNEDRTNWDTPYIMSAHNPDVLYRGTYRIYINTTGPDESWEAISPDLTDGVIFGNNFHNITSIAESPLSPDILYAGTSDGNVWRSLNMGGDWENINGTLPDRYVTSVHCSPGSADVVYTTISGYKGNGFLPHVFKSYNYGSTWEDISSDLPPMGVNDIWIMPDIPQDTVLAVATDIGVYGSVNGGFSWMRLGSNMPYVSVFDITYDPVNRRLVAGTFARSMMSFPIDSLLQVNDEDPMGIFTQISASAPLVIFPNPASQKITLQLPEPVTDEWVKMNMFNIQGQLKLIRFLPVNGLQSSVEVDDLVSGIYVVELVSGSKTYRGKVIVE